MISYMHERLPALLLEKSVKVEVWRRQGRVGNSHFTPTRSAALPTLSKNNEMKHECRVKERYTGKQNTDKTILTHIRIHRCKQSGERKKTLYVKQVVK